MLRALFVVLSLTAAGAAVLGAAEPALLNGQVLDETGATVPAATVVLYEKAGSVVFRTASNDDGEFFFAGMLPGRYLVEAYAGGLATPTAYEITLRAGPNPDVRLPLTLSAPAQHVNVTTAVAPQPYEQTSKALDVLSAAHAEARGLSSVSDALRFLPGLDVNTPGSAGGAADIQVRGLPPDGTALLLDGSPFRDPASPRDDAGALISQLQLANIARVEVVRGPGSSSYGNGAVSGTINLLTGGGGGALHGDVDLQGGGLGLFEGSAHITGGIDESRLSYVAALGHFSDTSSVGASHDWTGQSGAQYAFTPAAHAAVDLIGSESSTGGAAPALPGVAFSPFEAEAETPSRSRFFDGLFRFSDAVTPTFSYRLSYSLLTTARTFPSMGYSGARYSGVLQTANARASYSAGAHALLSGGYEFTSERYTQRTGDNWTRAGQDFHSAYAQDEMQFLRRRLAILLSVRGTRSVFNLSSWAGSASAAYFFERTGTKVRAHFGNGFRMPGLYERFGDYFFAGALDRAGNPGLRPEQTVSGEVGADQYIWAERVRVSATYYRLNLSRAITFDPATGDPAAGRPAIYFNAPEGAARGLELSAEVRPARRTSILASYTRSEAERQLQTYGVPRNRVKFVLGQTFAAGFDGAVDFDEGSSYPFFSSYRFAGPKQLGIAAGYRFRAERYLHPRLYVRVSNLLNQGYVADGFRTPGRWALAGLQLGF